MKKVSLAGLALVGALLGGGALAQEADADALLGLTIGLDTLWVLVAAALVFFMQAGFSLLEAGLQSAKNVVNILMKNYSDFIIASLAFWAVGFAFMFGDGNGILGLNGWFLMGPDNSPSVDAYSGIFGALSWTGVPLAAKFIFQLVFAGTAATIVSGAIGGRVKFPAYLIFSLVMTGLIYPVLGHWVWGGGWLAGLGFLDFAGSTVVHAVGGFAALGAVLVVGPRIGRYAGGRVNAMPGHNMTYAALGVFILWLGWFGFNPGSTMGIVGDPGLVAHIFLTTNLAAAAGAVVALAVSWARFGKPDFSMTINGVLAGLVAITAPCAFVGPVGALIIGAVGGGLVVWGILALDSNKIDDPVGAIAVHGICGMWGTMAVGLFGLPALGASGLFAGGGFSLFVVQLLGTVVISAAAFAANFLLWSFLKVTVGVRVSSEEEVTGLDIAEHGAAAYVTNDTLRDPILVTKGTRTAAGD